MMHGDEGGRSAREVHPPAFVGRDRELASVADAVSAGAGLVLVEGEAGIGKSRLVRECLALPALRDVVTATANCPPLPEPFSWGPLVEAVRRLRPNLNGVEVSPLAGALRPLFPEWAAELPPALEPLSDTKAVRHRVCRALSELLAALRVEVLVVEDAHWADAPTLEFLLMLSTSSSAAGARPLSLVVTYRPDDVPDGSSLLRLTALRPQVRVVLGPLDFEQTEQLVVSMFGTEVSTEFLSFLHERTEGLPLAVEESVRLLADRRHVARPGAKWNRRAVEDLEVPPTVRDLVLERVDRLDKVVRQVLEAAAVVAGPSSQDLLVTVAGLEFSAGRLGVAGALRCGLLHETVPGSLAFRHVLAAKAIADAVPASERRLLHHRAAVSLEGSEHPPPIRLSRHFREAGELDRWSQYAEAAAQAALESGDEHTAVKLLNDLLTITDHPSDQRGRLARRLGEAIVHRSASLGELETAVRDTLREIVIKADLPEAERGEIRLLLGWLLYQLGEFDAGNVEFEAAVGALDDRPASAAQAMLFLASPESPESWSASQHLQWLDRATALIPRVESELVRRQLQIDRTIKLLALGQEAGWQAVAEIPDSAPTPIEQHHIVRGRINAAQHAMDLGFYDDARGHLAAVEAVAPAIGYQRAVDFTQFTDVLLDWFTGAWAGLAERIHQVIDSDETHPLIRLEAGAVLGYLDLASGSRESAAHDLQKVMTEIAATRSMDLLTGFATAASGRLWLADGAADQVLELTDPIMDAIGIKDIWVRATEVAPVHVEALIAAGRVDDAAMLVRRFTVGLHGRTAPVPQAALATCCALLVEAQDAPELAAEAFAHAAAAWAAMPRPYDELLALERQGRCLLAANTPEQGLAVLGRAQERLVELGAQWDADRVARLLRQHGVEVARTWRRGRHGYGDGLSPRELAVLRIVARGLTNRQAAEALFISPKTVAHHLSRAMRKLGVSSRTALARVAADAGLLDDSTPHAK
ncbi:AAA family ATPase [Micromonospora arborensis]|uniref:ATP-binding protein n=1 Tax=Micromonospora arborensis TaxID=2116518 RepID=UPI0033C4C283